MNEIYLYCPGCDSFINLKDMKTDGTYTDKHDIQRDNHVCSKCNNSDILEGFEAAEHCDCCGELKIESDMAIAPDGSMLCATCF